MDFQREFTAQRIAMRLSDAKADLAASLGKNKISNGYIAQAMRDHGIPEMGVENVRQYMTGLAWPLASAEKFFVLAKVLKKDPFWLMFGVRPNDVVRPLTKRAEINDQEFDLLSSFRALPAAAQEKAVSYVRWLADETPDNANVRPFRASTKNKEPK